MEVFSANKVANDGTNIAKKQQDDAVKTATVLAESNKGNNDKDKEDKENVNKENVNEFVNKLNEDLSHIENNLEFSYNDDVDQMVITIKKKSDGEVVRTIPTEEAIELSKKMKDIVGALFDEKG
jgi:flagellar protein FlaG